MDINKLLNRFFQIKFKKGFNYDEYELSLKKWKVGEESLFENEDICCAEIVTRKILENAKISFDNSSKNRSISIALKVKGENEDSFQNWKDLLSAINSLQNFGLEYKNDDEKFPYRGIDFFSYDGLENLWNNK